METFPDFEDVISQLDGAPGQYALEVRNYLTSKFPIEWIGRTFNKCVGLKVPGLPGQPIQLLLISSFGGTSNH